MQASLQTPSLLRFEPHARPVATVADPSVSQATVQLRRNGYILFGVFLSLGLFLMFYHFFNPNRGFIVFQISILSLAYAVFVVLKRFSIDLLSPALLMFVYYFCAYSLAPLYMVFAKGLSVTQQDIQKTMWLVIVFIALVFAGYFLDVGRRIAERLPQPPGNWRPRSVRLLVCASVCFGLAGWLAILAVVGMSPLSQFLQVFEFRYRVFEVGGLYFFRNLVVWGLWTAFWVPFLQHMVKDRGSGRKGMIVYLVAAFVGLTVFTYGFGQRFMVVGPIISLLYVFNRNWRKMGFVPIVLGAVVILWFARFYENYRGMSWTQLDAASMLTESAKLDKKSHVFLGRRIEQGEGLADLLVFSAARVTNMLDYTTEIVCYYPPPGCDFFYGRSYLYAAVGFLPRSLFSSWRALFTDTFLTRASYHTPYKGTGGTTDYGIAFGQISELYINFKEFGLLGGLFWGIALKAVEVYSELNRRNPAVLLYYTSGFVNLLTACILLTTTSVNSINMIELAFFIIVNTIFAVALSRRI